VAGASLSLWGASGDQLPTKHLLLIVELLDTEAKFKEFEKGQQ
jgi:hypothetical protein